MPATPTLVERVAHRALGWDLGPEHREWVLDEVRSGRATWWSLAPAIVFLVVPAFLFQWAVARRTGEAAPSVRAVALLGGLLLGALLVRVRGRERLHARQLRARGLLPDGSPDPRPTWEARMRNEDRLAIWAFLLAGVTAVVGLLPHALHPEPARRCLDASAEVRGRLESALAPGVEVQRLQTWHDDGVSMVAAVVTTSDREGAAAATWLRSDDRLVPVDGPASDATPEIGLLAIPVGEGGRFVAVADGARSCLDQVASPTGHDTPVPPRPQ